MQTRLAVAFDVMVAFDVVAFDVMVDVGGLGWSVLLLCSVEWRRGWLLPFSSRK